MGGEGSLGEFRGRRIALLRVTLERRRCERRLDTRMDEQLTLKKSGEEKPARAKISGGFFSKQR